MVRPGIPFIGEVKWIDDLWCAVIPEGTDTVYRVNHTPRSRPRVGDRIYVTPQTVYNESSGPVIDALYDVVLHSGDSATEPKSRFVAFKRRLDIDLKVVVPTRKLPRLKRRLIDIE